MSSTARYGSTEKSPDAEADDGTAAAPVASVDPAPAADPGRPAWRRRLSRWRYDFVGTAFAVVFLCLSLTPSLLPRPWFLQAAISGITAAIGYGVGVFLAWLVRALVGRARSVPPAGRRAWWTLAAVGGGLVVIFLVLGAVWQRDIHRLMGLEPPAPPSYLLVLLFAAAIFAALVGLARLLRRAARMLARFLGRWVPAAAARLVGAVAVAVLAVFVLNGVLIDGLFSLANSSFKTVNGETEPGVTAPQSPARSGGPGSLVSWPSIGNEGRKFVAGGPSLAQLQQFSGTAPQQPIRIYAGLDSAPSAADRAALAVRDMQRTGAFSRRVLCVITTTGTGWIDAAAVDPLEYMYNGDSALVGMQYSYLPSWLSFLVDKAPAREAGRELFNQVYQAWSTLPRAQRPKLLVFGESLGSFGAESAFSGQDDIRNRSDGMLLLGPPNSNTLWAEYVANRDRGTREVLPTYQQGATVRFGADPADLSDPPSAWPAPRVVYLQHPSDPIVWWSPRLMLRRPDWLAERRGDDVLPAMRWYPFVTFWQTTADMAFSTGVPDGHGHNYGSQPVAAWAMIAAPDGWTAERTAALDKLITERS